MTFNLLNLETFNSNYIEITLCDKNGFQTLLQILKKLYKLIAVNALMTSNTVKTGLDLVIGTFCNCFHTY